MEQSECHGCFSGGSWDWIWVVALTMGSILTLSVMPEGGLLLEWANAKRSVSKALETFQRDLYDRFDKTPESWLFALGCLELPGGVDPSLAWMAVVARDYVNALARLSDLETLRETARVPMDDDQVASHLAGVPMMVGGDRVNTVMLASVWEALGEGYASLAAAHKGSVAELFAALNPGIHLAGRVFFHLVENRNSEEPFAFMATYSQAGPSGGSARHLPMTRALEEFQDEELVSLLSTVYRASDESELVAGLVESGELFYPLAWGADEAFQFLKEVPLYESCGVICRIPNWWKPAASGVGVRVSLGDTPPSFVGESALLGFSSALMMGDLALTEDEAREILAESEGLAFLKNRWVAVDHQKLAQALDACERARELVREGLTPSEAMRLQLRPGALLGDALADVPCEVSRGEWLGATLAKLENPGLAPTASPGRGFKATLRGYQQQGLNWLSFLDRLTFGACLADDMGLGKTVQLLAFLHGRAGEATKGPSLLVLPASLVTNWLNEIRAFAPTLRVFTAHPDYVTAENGRTLAAEKKRLAAHGPEDPDAFDLVITTYTLVQKYPWLMDRTWDCLVLDEAQAIKNPATRQTRAVKELSARQRIAMTGTPVENRLGDLWSLFDFLNPGLLGSRSEFAEFSKSLKDDPEGYARLRRLISPFVLRRLKTDTSIISDLPDKVVMKSYAGLSKKQVVLYRKGVEDLAHRLETAEGIAKRGLVLSSLMKFKQLCNHPDQYVGAGAFKESESGKFQRLREICETVLEKRERVLVFTQFKEMTEPLRAFLEGVFGHPGLVLHGGVPVGRRAELIDTFQADAYCPFMVLSLKAGGVGLNLTRANHVVHFDRWWNPAVENQATDRAFRIGQTKKVVVHTFVTKGTVEEKIDAMLEAKRDLADQVVSSSGETHVTEMADDELVELFTLTL
ncbi:non-specific serine/threonine protein kinase [Desulfoluna spongiiphila]|uniref:Non-specific serine/threonine protein kinase n=2 Tax=Desulfoluna spongiiphila TaxID=419481 RepID=A0A1G5EZ35_9BACT|nr:non-specific serine/threonine protein kinase [Desulfoluna spongiiphila]